MKKLRRGVSIDQLSDDLERMLNVQDSSKDVPPMQSMGENKFIVREGTGEIYLRSGGKLYKLTATEVT